MEDELVEKFADSLSEVYAGLINAGQPLEKFERSLQNFTRYITESTSWNIDNLESYRTFMSRPIVNVDNIIERDTFTLLDSEYDVTELREMETTSPAFNHFVRTKPNLNALFEFNHGIDNDIIDYFANLGYTVEFVGQRGQMYTYRVVKSTRRRLRDYDFATTAKARRY